MMSVGSVVISGEPWDRRPLYPSLRPLRQGVEMPAKAGEKPMADLVGCLVEVRFVDGTTSRLKILAVEPPLLKVGAGEWIGLASVLTLRKIGFSDAEVADLESLGLTLDDFKGDPRHDGYGQRTAR